MSALLGRADGCPRRSARADLGTLERAPGKHPRQEAIPLRQDLRRQIARRDFLAAAPQVLLHARRLLPVQRVLQRRDQLRGRIGIEVCGGVAVDLAVYRDAGGDDHAPAAHRLDTGEVEALADTWADRSGCVTVQDAQIRRWNGIEHEQLTAIDPRPEAAKSQGVVPAETTDDYQLDVRIDARFERLPAGEQTDVILARFYGRDAQQIPQRLPSQVAGVEALLLPQGQELRLHLHPFGRVTFVQTRPDDSRYQLRVGVLVEIVMGHHVVDDDRLGFRPRKHAQQVVARGLRNAGEARAASDVGGERVKVSRLVERLVRNGVWHEHRQRVVIAHDH